MIRRNPEWHEYFYQPEQRPAVDRKFWKGIAWGLVLSLPLWILAVVGILAIFAAKS